MWLVSLLKDLSLLKSPRSTYPVHSRQMFVGLEVVNSSGNRPLTGLMDSVSQFRPGG
jgi:hypothetical protein